MVESSREERAPALDDVLATLDDGDCRAIIHLLEEPMSATQLAERGDIPLSTAYRKLERLSQATLLDERTEIRPDGHHTSRYEIDFTEVRIGLDEERTLTLSIERPARTADERLAQLWGEVRKGA